MQIFITEWKATKGMGVEMHLTSIKSWPLILLLLKHKACLARMMAS